MRISDWSSDVCSSDLRVHGIATQQLPVARRHFDALASRIGHDRAGRGFVDLLGRDLEIAFGNIPGIDARQIGRDVGHPGRGMLQMIRSEEHTSELQSLMRSSYAVFCLKKKKNP